MAITIPIEGLPTGVGALSTTRHGGVSKPPFDSLNLGFHVGDDPAAVRENRRRVIKKAGPVDFAWLSQVHGTNVVDAADVITGDQPVEADASIARTPGVASVVMTADCLPVLFANGIKSDSATIVAAAHTGWRGLAAGVLEATVDAMKTDPEDLFVWLGPAIGPDVFEVGNEVRQAFINHDEALDSCFRPSPANPSDRWVADLYSLSRHRLQQKGVTTIFGGDACTYVDEQKFFSYRRDGQTGRMATAIWLR